MINVYKIVGISIVLALAFSCQSEEESLQQDVANLSKASPVTKLLSRVSQNPTSEDNILDGTSVFRVKLPVSITLNGTSLTVSSVSDYALIENLKNASNTDDDLVFYTFPITVVLRNYQEVVIANTTALQNLIATQDDLSELTCSALVYPISVNVYESSNQSANQTTLLSNSQVINFIFSLENTTVFSINYPISALNTQGQTVIINSNAELKSLLEAAVTQCGSSAVSGNFEEVLTSGSWRVSYFFDDGDETNDYVGFTFTFLSNNTIQVVKNGTTSTGTWSFYEDDGVNKLDLTFENSLLQELVDDWELFDFSNNTIQLKEDDNDEYLTFSKI